MSRNEMKRDRKEMVNRNLHSSRAELNELVERYEAIVAGDIVLKQCSEEGEGSRSRRVEGGKLREEQVKDLRVARLTFYLSYPCRYLLNLRTLSNKGCHPSRFEV